MAGSEGFKMILEAFRERKSANYPHAHEHVSPRPLGRVAQRERERERECAGLRPSEDTDTNQHTAARCAVASM